MDLYQNYIHKSRYARHIPEASRRESWEETVDRYCSFMFNRAESLGIDLNDTSIYGMDLKHAVRDSILNLKVMPSMRALMTAGKALNDHNVAGYNCSFLPIDSLRSFDEIMYILMNGTGVGFSVEKSYVTKIPQIAETFHPTDSTIRVSDSKIGWASAFRELLALLHAGKIPKWDMSKIRSAGTPLKTFGGRACLTGDTIVYKDRKKARGYNEVTIQELYDMKMSGKRKHFDESSQCGPAHFDKIKLRSLDEENGTFFRNSLLDVIYNGIAPVYEVLTENGYRIKATDNHRFMKDTGDYDFLSNFSEGDLIAVNGSPEIKTGVCVDCSAAVSRRAVRCRPCSDMYQINLNANHTTARQRKACRSSIKDNCENCGINNVRLVVHHVDENPHNNTSENLITLCETCHRRYHAKKDTFGDPYSHKYLSFDKIISITYMGNEPVFDLAMEGPNHNFIANGYVSHNSGPEPLESLFNFSVALFKRAAGRQLTSLEAHDLVCKVADIVVVGGVRRSALISLSDLEDNELRHAKSGQWWLTDGQRALANNSAVYKNSPDYGTFTEEWLALYRSKSGERGIFNRQAAISSMKEYGRRDADHQFGTNPCVVGSTRILTDRGYYPIEDLVGKQVNVWNGCEWSEVTPFATGKNKIVKVVLSDGTSLLTTYNHTFVLSGNTRLEASELQVGDKLEKYSMPVIEDGEFYEIDAYSQGFYSGDGCSGNTRSYLYSTKYSCVNRLSGRVDLDTTKDKSVWNHGAMFDKNFVPINGSLSFRLAWFSGLCDSAGTLVNNPNSSELQITSVNKDFLLNVKLMLTTMGVVANISQIHSKFVNNISDTDNNSPSVYRLLVNELDLSNLIDLGLNLSRLIINKSEIMSRLIINKSEVSRDTKRFVVVIDLDFNMGEEQTFCFTELKNHTGTFEGVVTGQCGEILLRPYQFCNLSEVVIRPEDTLETLKTKTMIATFLGTIQSTFTDFTYLRSIWKKNCEEERLLGVSLTGIMDHPVTSGSKGFDTLSNWLNELRELTIEYNRALASRLGINPSTAITCIKPSGTVSQLTNCSSGIHPAFSKYYVRTVRADIKDPLCNILKDAGIPCEPDVTKPNSVLVFSFPRKAPSGAVVRSEITAIDQLNLYTVYKNCWTEHNPSITVYVREDEWSEVGNWVFNNFNNVGGISFLPYSDHVYAQAPYQEISAEEYDRLMANFPTTIDWNILTELNDSTAGSQELACTAGGCEL